MPQSPKRMSLPGIPTDLPKGLYDLLDAIVHNMRLDNGDFGVSEKKPTTQDMIDAGITNADEIE